MSGYYIIYPKNYGKFNVGLAVVWPKKPRRTRWISHVEGPFDTEKEIIKWMNMKDIPNRLRPDGYKGLYNWICD